ncbi:MAG: V-type ATP synthase subunit D [Proteobacteria bacterium]|nr:V-type ATP synthase subunit D [Pseudomonadota bacterium]
MSKIRLTKNELNAQKGRLTLYERYLPALDLKKKHLQKEVIRVGSEIAAKEKELNDAMAEISPWVGLLNEEVELEEIIEIKNIITEGDNIAGVDIPKFVKADVTDVKYDLYSTPLWLDTALALIKKMLTLRTEIRVLKEQHKRLSAELLITSQRVNLFEKVKIPSSKHIIKRISIHLGDQQIAAVGWGRMAKKKIMESKR